MTDRSSLELGAIRMTVLDCLLAERRAEHAQIREATHRKFDERRSAHFNAEVRAAAHRAIDAILDEHFGEAIARFEALRAIWRARH